MPDSTTSFRPPNMSSRRLPTIDWLAAGFLVVAILSLPAGANSAALNSLAIVFVSIVLEAIPFMLVGSLIGGAIEVFVSRERLTALLPRQGWQTVCLAAAAGMLFPVCECAVVPVVRRLVGKGLPLSAAVGYLLGGPIVNPIVAASTALAYAFDWRMVALRMIGGYGLAVIIGLFMGRLFKNTTAIKDIGTKRHLTSCGCTHDPFLKASGGIHTPACERSLPQVTKASVDWMAKTGEAFIHAKNDFLAVGHYLVIGAFIAALGQTHIDRSLFMELADAPALSVILMMVMAVILNLCSEADAFIAASFRGLMPVSAQLAFLLTGPMFDLKLLMMYRSLFRKRAIVALACLVLVLVFLFSIAYAFTHRMLP